MARISKYKFDENVTENDFVIGSDGTTKKTRNFKLDDLTNFFAKQQEILGNKFSSVLLLSFLVGLPRHLWLLLNPFRIFLQYF